MFRVWHLTNRNLQSSFKQDSGMRYTSCFVGGGGGEGGIMPNGCGYGELVLFCMKGNARSVSCSEKIYSCQL